MPCAALIALTVLGALVTAAPPPGWVQRPAEPSAAELADVRFRVEFVPHVHNQDVLEAAVDSVSDPDSPRYGAYWTVEEVSVLTQPPPAVFATLEAYTTGTLRWRCGPSPHGDTWVCPAISAADVQAADWDVGFAVFKARRRATSTARVVMRAMRSPRLPPDVAAVVAFVAGLGVTHPLLPIRKSQPPDGKGADPFVVPDTVRAMFALPPGSALGPSVSVGAVQFQDSQAFQTADLQLYAQQTGSPFCQPTAILGPFDNSSAGDESALDASVISGLVCGGQATIWWQTIVDWLWEYASGRSKAAAGTVPDVSSLSWGWALEYQCDVDSAACSRDNLTSLAYVHRVEAELAKTVLLGQTHVVASGDAGCHGRTDEGCTVAACRAIYPGSSRYVVSVGATAIRYGAFTPPLPPLTPACSGETPCAHNATAGPCYLNAPDTGCFWTAGGGIAAGVARPAFQRTFVDAYLKAAPHLPPAGDYGNGRGYPDLAALGHNVLGACGGAMGPMDGTSASTPMAASILTFVNQARVAAGRPKLGLATYWLYRVAASSPATFAKVNDGNNACTEEACCATGFYSAPTQWDAVMGLGSPNVTSLMQLASMDVRHMSRGIMG